MNLRDFALRIFGNLPYTPTDQQVQLIAALAKFCSDEQPSDSVFLLNGYAGTGKTSLTGALVRALCEAGIPVVLMAPTGRAAKVFSSFAGFPATTIHRRIYRGEPGQLFHYSGQVADNPLQDGVFIVDEASMIGNDAGEGRGSLLEDLVQYVYSGVNCRLILLGDTAQLPPVGSSLSPAMNPDVLRSFGLRVTRAVLTATVRQRSESGILYNATRLRRQMKLDVLPEPRIRLRGFDDVRNVSGEELCDELTTDYSAFGQDNVIMITRSNRRAVQFNLAIRSTILDLEEELCVGERLLVAKNNYLWSAKVKGLDFIANGDVATVSRIYGTETKYGFRFADVTLTLPDYGLDVDCKILLDTLTSEVASLTQERFGELYEAIVSDPDLFTPSTPMTARMKIMRRDPYFNALQVKYAYAVTCHKAQGGQWPHVYIDMGAIAPDATTALDFYRWLYTALTRATEEVSFVNLSLKIVE